jgi:hypothetical protein
MQVFDSRKGGKPELSIVVPVYNTARYLEIALGSLSSAGLTDREIIVVVDGSPDDSEAVAVNWFQRTGASGLVLRIQNGGLSAARNRGAALARGTYLCFFDSDDIADANTHDLMLTAARAHDADLAIASAICMHSTTSGMWDFPDKGLWNELLVHASVAVTTVAREPRIFRLEPNMSCRIFRRAFFEQHQLKFPEGLYFEDFPVHVRSARLARRILLVKNTLLYYRVSRPGQITSDISERRLDVLETAAMALNEGHLEGLPENAKQCLVEMAINLLFWCGKHAPFADREGFFQRAVSMIEPYRDVIGSKKGDEGRAEPFQAVLAAFKGGDARLLWKLALILKNDIRNPVLADEEARDIAGLWPPPPTPVVSEEPATDPPESVQPKVEQSQPGLLQRFKLRRERA